MAHDKSIIESFDPYLPKVVQWINQLVKQSSPSAKPLSAFNFPRLPYYYSQNLLDNTKVVLVDQVPLVPLSKIGVTGLGHFENLIITGVTYLDHMFIDKKYQTEEWLYFHELVHVLQWQVLGFEDYLLAYGLGLYNHRDDYTKSFLEAMAYENHDIFRISTIPFNVEKKLKSHIQGHKAYINGLK